MIPGDFRKILDEKSTTIGNLKVAIYEHISDSIVLLGQATRTTSGVSPDINVSKYLYGELCIDVTAVSGTSPVLNIYVEGKDRYSGKYKVLFAHENITTAQTIWDTITILAFSFIRVRWTISGTSPSFTFSVSMEAKS